MIQQIQLKHSIKYGLIGGGLMTFYKLMLFIFGMVNNQNLSSFGSVFFIVTLYFSIRHYRDRQLDGQIDFGQAFLTGLYTAIVLALVGGIYQYIDFKYLSPGLFMEMTAQMIQNWEKDAVNSVLTHDQIEMQRKMLNVFLGPGIMAVFVTIGSVFMGSLISLMNAAILKRSADTFRKMNPNN